MLFYISSVFFWCINNILDLQCDVRVIFPIFCLQCVCQIIFIHSLFISSVFGLVYSFTISLCWSGNIFQIYTSVISICSVCWSASIINILYLQFVGQVILLIYYKIQCVGQVILIIYYIASWVRIRVRVRVGGEVILIIFYSFNVPGYIHNNRYLKCDDQVI